MGSDADGRDRYMCGNICLILVTLSCPVGLVMWFLFWFLASLPQCFYTLFYWGHLLTAGKFSLEGKVEHKFDMEPHSENFGEYGKLCRERTNKAMIKTRQVLVCIPLRVRKLLYVPSLNKFILQLSSWLKSLLRWLEMIMEKIWDPCLVWLAWFHLVQR